MNYNDLELLVSVAAHEDKCGQGSEFPLAHGEGAAAKRLVKAGLLHVHLDRVCTSARGAKLAESMLKQLRRVAKP
jgi:hypothetical protein